MNNPLDAHSQPKKVKQTKLTTLYWLNPRDSKKGRLWMPVYHHELPLKFASTFVYVSNIFEKNNISGNHYHHKKEEVIIAISGSFAVHLEDVKTKEQEVLELLSNEHMAVYIPTGVAHKIVSKEDKGILLVLASCPSSPEDEVAYAVK